MLNDIEIAEKAKLRKISDVAKDRLGISEDEIPCCVIPVWTI
jgi:formyltetrahydrofolate synthetase